MAKISPGGDPGSNQIDQIVHIQPTLNWNGEMISRGTWWVKVNESVVSEENSLAASKSEITESVKKRKFE